MEPSINAFGQATINSLDLHELFHPCSLDAREAAECLQQRRAAVRADARHSSSTLRSRAFSRRLRWPLIAKRCASSRTAATRCEAGEAGPGCRCASGVGEDQGFIASATTGPLATPTTWNAGDVELLQHIQRLRHLPAATVDQQDIRTGALALRHLRR